ncbi:Protein kinase domain-containing protein [Gammaproteobacteria bacterium]
MIDLFDASGQRVSLGKKLGTGGEGVVYDAPVYGPDFVAKVYHHPLSPNRQAKLLAMVEGGNESLRKVAAWPVDTIYATPRGAVCGFVMPKVIGYEPVHHLYGPGHRKQQFPNADWAFLVNTARNVAAAFDVIHSHHHVIGDVNQNNVVVARSSVVKLIDCDSFQVTTATKHYLCEVGVGHFTPPELQGHSFHGVHRTRNHDNFGLAVLVFHLLLMGRHPYSGVYSGTGEMPVEKAIQEFRFAFGSNAAAKKMAPPPNSVTLNILPPAIAWLFERAFAEENTHHKNRPTAREWLSALDALKGQLQTCNRVASHQYFDVLDACPWCLLEQQARIFFFNSPVDAGSVGFDFEPSKFDLARVWDEINAIPSPGAAPLVNPAALRVHPTPLPDELNSSFRIFKASRYRRERKRREAALENARSVFASRLAKWKEEAGDEVFNKKFRELFHFHLEYEQLLRIFEIEREQFRIQTQGRPLVRLLRIIFRRKSQKAAVVSVGISRVTDQKTAKKNQKTGAKKKGRGFFGQAKDEVSEDTTAFVQRFIHQRDQLEVALGGGAAQLRQLHEQIIFTRQAMYTPLMDAAQVLAQAEADLRVMRE